MGIQLKIQNNGNASFLNCGDHCISREFSFILAIWNVLGTIFINLTLNLIDSTVETWCHTKYIY